MGREKPGRDSGFSDGDRDTDSLPTAQGCRPDRKQPQGKEGRWPVGQCSGCRVLGKGVPAEARHVYCSGLGGAGLTGRRSLHQQPGRDGVPEGNRARPLWHLSKASGDSGAGYGSSRNQDLDCSYPDLAERVELPSRHNQRRDFLVQQMPTFPFSKNEVTWVPLLHAPFPIYGTPYYICWEHRHTCTQG